ncbi:hypothetical protein ACIPY5_19730 [Microbacterium sp. NPDC089698]|uniref:hypothetical protein n=1 Tax=Microbacterium sp. NPDC089698 TaxID=3364200 RepID=UPI00381B8DF4
MKKIRTWFAGAAAAVLVSLAVVNPGAGAFAAEGGLDTATPAVESTVETVPMTIDCSTFTEQDRQKAVSLGLNYCGALAGAGAVTTRGTTPANCGTASVYAERAGGQMRVSWGLHSTSGPMLERFLSLEWGPMNSGGYPDSYVMYTEDYSNSINTGTVKSGKAGATLRGWVAILGWNFTCTVLADDPPHYI